MAVLVTGANGLVGQALINTLNRPVYAATRSKSGNGGTSSNVKYIELDLLDESSIEDLPWDDIEDVVHLAAYTNPRGSVNEPHRCFQTNASGTSALLSVAKDAGISTFLFISSYWVYDQSATGTLDESTPLDVETPYAASKAAAEFQCNTFREQYGLTVTTLRPFNIYGPGAKPHQVVPEFVQQAIGDGVIKPHPGNPVRDFLYVGDMVRAIQACLTERTGQVFNIGSGEGTSIRYLANVVADTVEQHAEVEIGREFSGDTEPSDEKVADTSKLRSAIDWEPKTSLVAGIEATVQHYIQTNNDYGT